MASDRWDDHGPSMTLTAKSKSTGINPSSFYKTLNDKKLTPTERKLGNVLQLAAHNEVVHKRSEHTAVQKMQRDCYHRVTIFKTFPLQDLAMECLFSMMKEYLGGAKPTSQSGRLQREDINEEMKTNEACVCGDDRQQSPLNDCKRRKLQQKSDIDVLDDFVEKYTSSFLAEQFYSPLTENGKHQETEKLNGDAQFCFLPELWSMEPRIFALETSSSGKRRYIVGQLGRFLQHYWRESDPRSRHYYELIREGTPCRLYFDLEFCKNANKHITSYESELLMKEFIEELCSEIQLMHGIQIDRSCIVDLDSTTDKKFSRHLIIHFPNGELFADACSAGVFVKRFVGRLADEVSTGVHAARRPILAKHLFVNAQVRKTTESKPLDPEESSEHIATSSPRNGFDNKNHTCFVDLGVYTRNRLFRLMGSTKFGKSVSAALRIAGTNECQFPADFNNSNFYLTDHISPNTTYHQNYNDSPCDTNPSCNQQSQASSMSRDHDAFCASLDWESHARALAMTLVVPANTSKANALILTESNNGGRDSSKVSVPGVVRQRKSSTRSCNGPSPIPKLDKFILESSKLGGVQGKIYKWSIECVSNEGKPDSYYMSYQMSGNKWCENIGRAHKSNNIIWNLDLTGKTYWQTCHDPECRAANFRGRSKRFPEEVATDVSDHLLDIELSNLDEAKIIHKANLRHLDFEDGEFDEALSGLDMSLFAPRNGSAV